MIDLQVNGLTTKNFSCNFWECPDDESISALCKYEFTEGISSFLATLITDSPESIEKQLIRISEYKKAYKDCEGSAEIYGVHIEGGMISRMGVHPEKYSSALGYKEAENLLKIFPGLIKVWTLCPTKDPQGDLTRVLQDHGVIVSYGHSNASYEEGMRAFDRFGVRLVTHWGNAMYVAKDFSQRNPGAKDLELINSSNRNDVKNYGIGLAALDHPEVFCPVICGSHEDHDLHLAPEVVKIIAEKKPNHIILVSDSVAYEKPQAPETLVGGLNTLKKHSANAFRAGLSADVIEKATLVNPRSVINRPAL